MHRTAYPAQRTALNVDIPAPRLLICIALDPVLPPENEKVVLVQYTPVLLKLKAFPALELDL